MPAFRYSAVQDCSNSIALAMELLQSYTKPSIEWYEHHVLKQYDCKDSLFLKVIAIYYEM